MKAMKTVYYMGVTISMLVGVWHFFVPHIWWHEHLPPFQNLIVGIDYMNFSFSLLLSGLSLLLLVLGKKLFERNREVLIFFGLLVLAWLCRAALTFIHPWPLYPIEWAAHGQQIAANTLFVMLLTPFLWLLSKQRTK